MNIFTANVNSIRRDSERVRKPQGINQLVIHSSIPSKSKACCLLRFNSSFERFQLNTLLIVIRILIAWKINNLEVSYNLNFSYKYRRASGCGWVPV